MFGRAREKAKRDAVEKNLLERIGNEQSNAEHVLKIIDELPTDSKKWLKTLTPEEGSLLDDIVQKFDPRVALEFGFSGGCTAVRIASKMKKADSKLVSQQVRTEGYTTAKTIIERAGLSQKVRVYANREKDKVVADLREFLGQTGARYFDFVFLDGYTNRYLDDFKFLKDKDMIGKGTVIVANNTKHAGFQNYVQYLKDHAEELETETYNKSGSASLTVSIYMVD